MKAVCFVFTNSQPSAADGSKWSLWPIPQCFRTAYKYGNVSGIYVVITNLYRTPSLGGGRFMICTRYAQPLVGTLFCRVALGQSSLMGRWVHSPNQCYNFILLSAMKWNGLLFGSVFKWFSYRNDTIIFDRIMINLSEMMVWPSFGAVSIKRKQDRNGTGDRVGGAVRQGIPGL